LGVRFARSRLQKSAPPKMNRMSDRDTKRKWATGMVQGGGYLSTGKSKLCPLKVMSWSVVRRAKYGQEQKRRFLPDDFELFW
jgi:hypothetical protein